MHQDSDIRRREVIVSQSIIEGWQSQLKSRMVQIQRLENERESLKKLIEAGQLVLMNSELEWIREQSEREARARTEAAVLSVGGHEQRDKGL